MENPAETSLSHAKAERSPSAPVDGDSFHLDVMEKDPVQVERIRTSKISISTIDDAPPHNERPDMPSLDDLG